MVWNITPQMFFLRLNTTILSFHPNMWSSCFVEELDIGNAGPTTVHINIKHHGVNEMKKRFVDFTKH